jgi:vacuolar-type H+-ATPase catalytic subunit A/Vma1
MPRASFSPGATASDRAAELARMSGFPLERIAQNTDRLADALRRLG